MLERTLLVLLFPLVSFFVGLTFGKKWKYLAHFATVNLCVSFALSFSIFIDVQGGKGLYRTFNWLHFEGLGKEIHLQAGFWVNKLSALMMLLVTGIATLVHLFSISYIRGEKYAYRYWALLGLFCFSMLGIVVSSNLLFIFMFWEGVGVCSYFLIGFWFEREAAAAAAQKAFVMNRIGDLGFISGILLLFAHFGTTDLISLQKSLYEYPDNGLLFWASLLIFGGSIGKSAQFPLQTWLPDAMQGPTPVSSLIHAATMVAAGVYLIPRADFLFGMAVLPSLHLKSLDIVALVGGITAISAAVAALTQHDLKRTLAYSTLSQLGLMMLGMGVGATDSAFFHLLTHAFFKCGLFLSAALIIHSLHHLYHQQHLAYDAQDIRLMGGLKNHLKKTYLVFSVFIFSLSGLPFFSGFLSKEGIFQGILTTYLAEGNRLHLILLCLAFATSLLTAFYSFRLWFLVFWGENRLQKPEIWESLHENDKKMLFPLGVLAFCSTFIVFSLNPVAAHGGWWSLGAGEHTLSAFHHGLIMGISLLCLLAGGGLAYLQYKNKRLGIENQGFWFKLSFHHFYQNQFYEYIAKQILAFTALLSHFDKTVVDGLVNGISHLFYKPRSHAPSLSTATVLLDNLLLKATDEPHHASISPIFARFDKQVLDGFVNGIASGIRGAGTRLRQAQGNELQKYVLVSVVGLLLMLLGLVYVFRGQIAPNKERQTPTQTDSTSLLYHQNQREIMQAVIQNDSIKGFPIRQILLPLDSATEWLQDSLILATSHRLIDSSLHDSRAYASTELNAPAVRSAYHQSAQADWTQDSLLQKHLLKKSVCDQIAKLPNLSMDEQRAFWEQMQQQSIAAYYELSLPYLTAKQDFALMSVKLRCGAICGGGHRLLLRKEAGKWVIARKFLGWGS